MANTFQWQKKEHKYLVSPPHARNPLKALKQHHFQLQIKNIWMHLGHESCVLEAWERYRLKAGFNVDVFDCIVCFCVRVVFVYRALFFSKSILLFYIIIELRYSRNSCSRDSRYSEIINKISTDFKVNMKWRVSFPLYSRNLTLMWRKWNIMYSGSWW